MKPKTFTKVLSLDVTPTKELLTEAYNEYKAENWKDAAVTALLHRAALKFVEKGSLNSPGRYHVRATFFSKNHSKGKVVYSITKD